MKSLAQNPSGVLVCWGALIALIALPGCSSSVTTPLDSPQPEVPAPEPLPWVTGQASAIHTQRVVFESDVVRGPVSFHVYVPEVYAEDTEERFPVLVWLHGGGGGIAGIPPLVNLFHGAMARGDIPPMLLVFPNGLPLGMWTDSVDGRQPVETLLMTEILPLVDATYRTLPPASGRILEGWSMGGYGALRLGLIYSGAFAGISALGAGPLQLDFLAEGPRSSLAGRRQILEQVYGGSLDRFAEVSPWRLAETVRHGDAPGPGVPLRLGVGLRDELFEMNLRFHTHLTELGIPHEFIEVDGVGHDPLAFIQALGDEFWRFHREVLDPPHWDHASSRGP